MKYSPPSYMDPQYGLNLDQLRTIEILRAQSPWKARAWQHSSSRSHREDRAPFIYKYMSFDPGSALDMKKAGDGIVAGNLWLSSLDSLNDVDEARAEIDLVNDPVALRKWADKHARNLVKSLPKKGRREAREAMVRKVMGNVSLGTEGLEDAYRKNIRRYGVHCFSVDPRSLSMWGLYAAGQSGMCLQFERIKCLGVLTLTHRVRYQDEPVRLVWPGDRERVLDFMFTKSREWERESEVRYVSQTVSQNSLPFDARALTGIILGRRFEESADRLEALFSLLSQRASYGLPLPKLYRTGGSRGTFKCRVWRARDLEWAARHNKLGAAAGRLKSAPGEPDTV